MAFGFDKLLDQWRQQPGVESPQGDRPFIFGKSKLGQKAGAFTPEYLKGAAGAGGGLGDFFAQAFQQLGDKRGLNAQLGLIGQDVAGRARKARTTGRFKGSPIGEALASGIQTGGQSLEQQARLRDEANRMKTGMALTQAFSGAVTSPLLNVLGLTLGEEQAKQALAEQRRQFDKSQPSTFDKVLGFVGGMFCWVAREVLQDERWVAARAYMLNEAPEYTKRLYAEHGEELAAKVRKDPALRTELKPVFEEFARRGAKYLKG
jgi:hypothetical protein